MTQPDLSALLNQWWGGFYEGFGTLAIITTASNIVVGGNGPYGPNEFFAQYPKFGGVQTKMTANLVSGSSQAQLTAPVPLGITVGQFISDALLGAVPVATQITAIDTVNNILTLSNAAIEDVTGDTLLVYPAPVVPVMVVLMYCNLAQACLSRNRWLEQWLFAMGLFVAHYCTLWLRSEGSYGTTAGQIAASGLEKGIIVSKSVGDVSAGVQLPSGLEDWGAYQETTYGVQLATLANIIGWGPIYVY